MRGAEKKLGGTEAALWKRGCAFKFVRRVCPLTLTLSPIMCCDQPVKKWRTLPRNT